MEVTRALTPEELIEECESYIQNLHSFCVGSMRNREYSPIAKLPYKIMLVVNSMTWRVYETASSALLLMKRDSIIPALCLVRACWEDMAATFELASVIDQCCKSGNVGDKEDEILMRILFSNRFDNANPHVGEYTYEKFKDYKAKNIITLVQSVEKHYPAAKGIYETLCEFVHPNGDGVRGSYSKIDEESDITTFGPLFSQESELFPAFVLSLSSTVSLYTEFVEQILCNINPFARLCEISLKRKSAKL